MLTRNFLNDVSIPFRKLAEGYGDYYQREPSFWDTFADHPTLVAGGGAALGGAAGFGGHRLGTWAALRRHDNALANHYKSIGQAYENARANRANIIRSVEDSVARSNTRAGIEAANKGRVGVLATAKKYKLPAVGLGALIGGMLAYNHFFG